MPPIKQRLSGIYTEFERAPGLAKFHRFMKCWYWVLSNGTWKIQKLIAECNRELGHSDFDITDYHLANLDQEYPELNEKIDRLEGLFRQYGADLLMASQVASLSKQKIEFAQAFAKEEFWFRDGVYGPTGEDESLYRTVPADADFCTLDESEEQDLATGFLRAHLNGMYRAVVKSVWYIERKLGREVTQETERRRYADLKIIELCMHFVAAVFVPVLLSCTLGALSALDSERDRIIVLGGLCLLLCWSLIMVTSNLRRSELFAIASAYFAVGGIFIGTKSSNGT